MSFDSLEPLQKRRGSPEGKANANDLAHFAQAGVELLMLDTKEV